MQDIRHRRVFVGNERRVDYAQGRVLQMALREGALRMRRKAARS